MWRERRRGRKREERKKGRKGQRVSIEKEKIVDRVPFLPFFFLLAQKPQRLFSKAENSRKCSARVNKASGKLIIRRAKKIIRKN